MDLEAVEKHLEAARQELSTLCHGKRWQMSIPAQPNYDSDLLIGQALRDAHMLMGEVKRLRQIYDEVLAQSHKTMLSYLEIEKERDQQRDSALKEVAAICQRCAEEIESLLSSPCPTGGAHEWEGGACKKCFRSKTP